MSQNKRSFSYANGDTSAGKLKPCAAEKRYSSFVEGSIVRIRLSKFLTYDSVEFKTGPYLNVIIGPNGTGKSAIVCAICLGLAGKANSLGRASELKDFIKYGAYKASVEIELFNPHDKNYVIRREITTSNTSNWWYNGHTATLKSIEELVASLNIQVGNLCQFLPQEKVADFARMSQQELLENTEKSIGRSGIHEIHQSLKSARQTARQLEQEVSEIRKELDQEKQKNARLEQDVQLYKDRQTFLEKVDILKMKRPWLEYDRLKAQFERAKTERDKRNEALKKEQTQISPLEKRHRDKKTRKDDLDRLTKEMSQKIQHKSRDLKEQNNLMTAANDKIDEAKREYDSRVKEEELREKRLNDLKEQLKALESSLVPIEGTDSEQSQRQLQKVSDELSNVSSKLTAIQSSGERLQREIGTIKSDIRENEAQIKKIQDVGNRRLETLKNLHAHTYEAVVWLRTNKNIFKHAIHEPMIISLNVRNPADARLVEAHISFNDLRSFVCDDPEDLDLFMRKVKNEQKLRINAVRAPPEPESPFLPNHPIGYYKKYGFERYMQSLFTCPESVMRFLCLQYKVHQIPIGSAHIRENIQKILTELPELTNFYTPDVQYVIKRSKYNKSVSSRNSALRDPRALADSANIEREQELAATIKEAGSERRQKEAEYRVLQKQSDDLVLQINGLREEKLIDALMFVLQRNLMKKKEEKKLLKIQITTKEQRIAQIVKEKLNLEEVKDKFHHFRARVVHEKFRSLEKMKEISLECVDLAKQRVEKSLLTAECVRELSDLDAQLRVVSQRYESLKKEVEDLKEHTAGLKFQAREKLVEAKKLAGIGLNEQLEEELKERGVWELFQQASNNLDELDNEIHSMQARAEVMFQIDEQIVGEFEVRERQIKRLEEKLHGKENDQKSHQESIAQAKTKWLEPLTDLIQQINNSFSHFFACLNCVGEVSLSEPENSEDYEKYGVCIKVKFRDDETLQELTAHRQSGGERSVSTVLYMMALQELTKCPFRCVDEINQGMDPKNERKIFQLVVQTVCRKSVAQYFLLTPKLLPDLEYDKNMTVLCIYNSVNMVEHTRWNLDQFIERRGALGGV